MELKQASNSAPSVRREYKPVFDTADHFFNPANTMSLSRPIIGAIAANKLVNGETGVTALVALMALTDAEGKVARAIDKRSIKRTGQTNGYGVTKIGKTLDPIADSLGFVEVAVGAIGSKRISWMGRAAMTGLLAQETAKSAWFAQSHKAHTALYPDEEFRMPVNKAGKMTTFLKFIALASATMTHDLEPGTKRNTFGILALGGAAASAITGKVSRRGYNDSLNTKGIYVSTIPSLFKRSRLLSKQIT